MISKRLVTIGMAIVFFGAFQALEADGVEEALGDCVAAAVVATLLTWASTP